LIDKLEQRIGLPQGELRRFVKFAIVGAVGTVLDFGVLNLLILVAGLPKFWANTCSFAAGSLNNFLGNRFWSFPESKERPFLRQFGQFLVVGGAGWVLNQAIFLGLSNYVFAAWGTLGFNLAKAVAVAVVLFWNFGINRIWTYRGI
jgi:putative flippase GtrA